MNREDVVKYLAGLSEAEMRSIVRDAAAEAWVPTKHVVTWNVTITGLQSTQTPLKAMLALREGPWGLLSLDETAKIVKALPLTTCLNNYDKEVFCQWASRNGFVVDLVEDQVFFDQRVPDPFGGPGQNDWSPVGTAISADYYADSLKERLFGSAFASGGKSK